MSSLRISNNVPNCSFIEPSLPPSKTETLPIPKPAFAETHYMAHVLDITQICEKVLELIGKAVKEDIESQGPALIELRKKHAELTEAYVKATTAADKWNWLTAALKVAGLALLAYQGYNLQGDYPTLGKAIIGAAVAGTVGETVSTLHLSKQLAHQLASYKIASEEELEKAIDWAITATNISTQAATIALTWNAGGNQRILRTALETFRGVGGSLQRLKQASLEEMSSKLESQSILLRNKQRLRQEQIETSLKTLSETTKTLEVVIESTVRWLDSARRIH